MPGLLRVMRCSPGSAARSERRMARGFDRLKAGLQRLVVSEMCWPGRAGCGRLSRKSLAVMKPLSVERSASGCPNGGVSARCDDVSGYVPGSPGAITPKRIPKRRQNESECA